MPSGPPLLPLAKALRYMSQIFYHPSKSPPVDVMQNPTGSPTPSYKSLPIYVLFVYQIQLSESKSSFSDRADIDFGVTQGFILGPTFFNIKIIDLFYNCEDSNVASYVYDTTLYSCATSIPSVALELQVSTTNLFCWFKNNHLKANPGKSHILLSSKKPLIVSVDEIRLAASSHEKITGVIIDSELKFENDITKLFLTQS